MNRSVCESLRSCDQSSLSSRIGSTPDFGTSSEWTDSLQDYYQSLLESGRDGLDSVEEMLRASHHPALHPRIRRLRQKGRSIEVASGPTRKATGGVVKLKDLPWWKGKSPEERGFCRFEGGYPRGWPAPRGPRYRPNGQPATPGGAAASAGYVPRSTWGFLAHEASELFHCLAAP